MRVVGCYGNTDISAFVRALALKCVEREKVYDNRGTSLESSGVGAFVAVAVSDAWMGNYSSEGAGCRVSMYAIEKTARYSHRWD